LEHVLGIWNRKEFPEINKIGYHLCLGVRTKKELKWWPFFWLPIKKSVKLNLKW
jgi:hypothetical protein